MKRIILLMSIGALLPVEFYFSEQANYITNTLVSSTLYTISCTSIVVAIVLILVGKANTAAVVLFIGFLLVVPYNLYFTYDLNRLKTEADRVVHRAYLIKSDTQSFPKKISEIGDSRIKYTLEDAYNFTVFFYVTSPNTGHFYSSKNGWAYMDD